MDVSEIAKELGKRGGEATVKKYGKEHFAQMGKKSKRGKAKKEEVKEK